MLRTPSPKATHPQRVQPQSLNTTAAVRSRLSVVVVCVAPFSRTLPHPRCVQAAFETLRKEYEGGKVKTFAGKTARAHPTAAAYTSAEADVGSAPVPSWEFYMVRRCKSCES